ncbi:hypothetical protein [Reichenbachiella agariperforans]|nr:hypothetical protein [Reichenbachiella agariperforans]
MRISFFSFFRHTISLICFICLTSSALFAQCPTENDLANGGVFSGNCTVNVGDEIEITGAIFWTSGRLTINGGDGDVIIENNGSITIQDGATLDLDDGDLYIEDGGSLTVESGGAVEVLDNGRDIFVSGDLELEAGSSMEVADFAYIEDTGDVSISGDFVTGDDIEIDGGRVVVKNGGSLESGDNIDVYGDGVLRIDEGGSAATSGGGGDVTNSDPDGDEGQGTIIVNGTLTVSDDVVIEDTDPSTVLTGSGTLTVENDLTDEEGNEFSNCGGDGVNCEAEEPAYTCDEDTACTPSGCPTAAELEAGGVFCGNCTIDDDISIENDVCWVSGNLVIEDGDLNIVDEATLTVVGGSIAIEDGDVEVQEGTLLVLAGATFEVDEELVVDADGKVDISGTVTTGSNGGTGVEIDEGTVVVRDGGTLTSGQDIDMSDGAVLVVQEGGTVNIINGGDLENDGPATVIVDGTLNVDDDVDFEDSNPSSTITGTGTINVNGEFDDGDGGTFSDCAGGDTCEAVADDSCDESTVCTENSCPINENDLRNGGTFCGDCYLDIGNTVRIEADVCWVSGTLTLDGDGQDGEFDLETGVTFTVVSGTVIVEDGGADVMTGSTLTILNGGTFVIDDELRIDEAGTVIVNGVLEVGNNIDIGETSSGSLIVDGGQINTESIDNDIPGNLDDLPDNVVIENGGAINATEVSLPVSWVSFTASLYNDEKDVLLKWLTASEISNDGFYVEKSTDGQNFDEIGFVKGHGNINSVSSYQFVDFEFGSSAYYRLKQVDFDGKYDFSRTVHTIKSRAETPLKHLNIYPNPSSQEIVIDGLPEGLYSVLLVDITGSLLLQLTGVSPQQALILINDVLSNHHSGTFVVKFVSSGYSSSGKILRY